MASPRDETVLLEDVSALVQTQYDSKFHDQTPDNFGMVTNKYFKVGSKPIVGDGLVKQYKYGKQDSVRFARDPLGDFAAPKTFTPGQVKIRWNKDDLANHDFNTYSAAVQVDDIDKRVKGAGSIIDYAQELVDDLDRQEESKLAIHRHLPRTGQVALVNGTPTLNNRLYISGATGTATNSGGGRVAVDSGSIAALPAGTYIDFINPSTGAVRAGNIMVTDNNPGDLSIGFAYISDASLISTGNISTMQSTGDLSTVADNDIIVYSGEYNVGGMYSLGAWFATPAASGDSFFGKDRNSALYRWMVPRSTRQGAQAAALTQSMFDDQSNAMALTMEEINDGFVWSVGIRMHTALRSLLGETAFRPIDPTSPEAKRYMTFGTIGLNYQHPAFGLVKIIQDPLCPEDVVRVINLGTWTSYHYNWKGMVSVPGMVGMWYRMPQSAPNSGLGKMWKADWYGNICDWCEKPFANGQICNVTP